MKIKIYREVKNKILESIGNCEAESGGIIACNQEDTITEFYFDFEAGSGKTSYIPSQNAINKQVNEIWRSSGYCFCGIVHSHPAKASYIPSVIDLKMAEKIVLHNHLEEILLMIIHKKIIRVWKMAPNSQLEPCELTMI